MSLPSFIRVFTHHKTTIPGDKSARKTNGFTSIIKKIS